MPPGSFGARSGGLVASRGSGTRIVTRRSASPGVAVEAYLDVLDLPGVVEVEHDDLPHGSFVRAVEAAKAMRAGFGIRTLRGTW
ncbi:hypothetical protein [Streptomyces colonosanans]|uniref:Uncharacterized protein n=1 Tax=Streptomyces colonosanans TaxID=1428652 RepID=A0A1S2Q4R1_9ACTN|nr:hypothetical protein [Streptomyces colonosanans]OIK01120.1 hypothetical protein BIV24_01440 [Streptomyces colonosanans]